jgi:hypothetical protein
VSDGETTQKIQELERLRSQIRVWRGGSAIVVIVIVFFFVTSVTNAIRSLVNEGPKRDELVGELRAGFVDTVMPEVKAVAVDAAHQLTPVVMEEVQKLDFQSPRITAALEQELDELKNSIPRRAEVVLDATFGKMVRERRGALQKMYPDLTDEKIGTLLDNLVGEGETRIFKVVDDTLRPHLDVLDDIVTSLHEIQRIEEPNLKGEKPGWDVAFLLFDVIREDFEGLRPEDVADALQEANPEVMR